MSVCYRTIPIDVAPAFLLDEAIRRAVARAIDTGEVLNVEAEARRLAAGYPGTAPNRIAELLIEAGVGARINLELGLSELAMSHGAGASAEPDRVAAA